MIGDSQDNMSPLQPSHPTTAGPEKCNMEEAQDKNFNMAFMDMLEVLKEDTNTSIKSTKTVESEMKKTVQDLQVEIESIKKTQT